MIRIFLPLASLLLALHPACLNNYTETAASSAPVPRHIAGHIINAPPDTTGIYAAFSAFLRTGYADSSTALTPYWKTLAMINDTSGVVSCSVHFDDATGFTALFFRKNGAEFVFQMVDASFPAETIDPALLTELEKAIHQR